MKKVAQALKMNAAPAAPKKKERPGKLMGHEHIHAANCGHPSYVHGDHIDYEHNGHYHFMEDGHTYACDGPNAKIIPFPKKK